MASGLPLLTSSRNGLMYQSDFRDKKTTNSDETLFSVVPKGTCTYRHMSDDDIFHLNMNVLEKGLVSREYPVFTASEGNDLEFVVQHINSSDRFRAFCKGQKKGGTRTRLYYKTLCEFEMMVPSIEEQRKISSTLSNLDHLITLHHRKCKHFNDLDVFDWEQRKVGDFLTESRESGHKGDVAHKMTVKLWGKGIYEKNENGSANTQYFTRHAGQFIYSKLDFLNCAFGVVPEELESFETTADVPAFDCDGVNPYFMFYTAMQPSFYEKNGIIADGSRKAKRIHAETFLNMPFFVPSLEEQNKSVNLLSELDHLITLHHHKLLCMILGSKAHL